MPRLILIALLITPLFAYLEWGGNKSSAFLWQAEYALLFQGDNLIHSFTHPIVLMPMLGQILIIWAILQNKPPRKLVFIGILLQSVLLLFILLVGFLAFNYKIILSTIPFFISVGLFFRFKNH
jgi:hypothetical protein